ncbi:hypothetical protein ACFL2D_02395 [Patescibacteria group bacterium]
MQDVLISNKEHFEKNQEAIIEAGPDKLHFIADFDRTLTKAFVNGNPIASPMNVIRDEGYLGPEYTKQAQTNFDKYHPIEIDPEVSKEDKTKAMEEWWTKQYELLKKHGLNKKHIDRAIRSRMVELREETDVLLATLNRLGIPLVIMSSSGLGNYSIRQYLKKEKLLFDNIYIVSNSFEWDDEGYLLTVKEPIIHSLNKYETTISGADFYPKIKQRKNVVLLGDSLDDIGMVEGFDFDNLIKIAFLNPNTEANTDAYNERYDVLLLGDTNMNFVNEFVAQLSAK